MLQSSLLVAQTNDSTSSSKKFIPTGIRFGLDVVPLARAEFAESFQGFEGVVDFDIYRYYPTVEFGNSSRSFISENGNSYQNEGRFWRAGADVNFMKKDPDKNIFSLGFRYGRSTYSESASLNTVDPLWGNFQRDFSNTDLSANWLELTTSLRVKIWKIFWLGYTARFKGALRKDQSQTLLTTDVPGYGSTEKNSTWGFSYYVLVRLPIRKQH